MFAVSLAAPAGADPGRSNGSESPSPSPVGSGLAGPTPAASPSDPSGSDSVEYWRSARAHAVALVLATDPRFAGLPDNELQRRRSASEFSLLPVLGSHYRVLSTDADLSHQGGFVYRTPASWLIEVTLTRDCVEPTTAPAPDPCGWRHSWYYRVLPDGTVTPLYGEGDPDEG